MELSLSYITLSSLLHSTLSSSLPLELSPSLFALPFSSFSFLQAPFPQTVCPHTRLPFSSKARNLFDSILSFNKSTFDHLFVFDLRRNKIIRFRLHSRTRCYSLTSTRWVVRAILIADGVQPLPSSLRLSKRKTRNRRSRRVIGIGLIVTEILIILRTLRFLKRLLKIRIALSHIQINYNLSNRKQAPKIASIQKQSQKNIFKLEIVYEVGCDNYKQILKTSLFIKIV